MIDCKQCGVTRCFCNGKDIITASCESYKPKTVVYIKGMDVPTSCDGSCPIYDREFLRCNITGTEPWHGHDGEPIEDPIPVPPDCPIGHASDVRPVVHGRWVYDSWCKFRCSECRELSRSTPPGRENYCPNCGAKMDGGQDDV